jgi:hypothetical protein
MSGKCRNNSFCQVEAYCWVLQFCEEALVLYHEAGLHTILGQLKIVMHQLSLTIGKIVIESRTSEANFILIAFGLSHPLTRHQSHPDPKSPKK